MPRKPRFYLPGVPVHLVQRGHSRAPVFFEANIKGFDPFNSGRNQQDRYRAYQAIFTGHIDESDMKRIREAWQTGTPLGNDLFRERVEQQLQCKVGIARRGRPVKKKEKGFDPFN